MGFVTCQNQNSCPECETFERLQREERIRLEAELLKLRTGLARLAFKAGLGEFIPGKPSREAPFEVLEKAAKENDRGWNALMARLMDSVGGG
jgi:hypothetical protein